MRGESQARVPARNRERESPLSGPLAIVDVETTGQSAMYGRVIEIAILRVEKGRIVRTFESLVNPERYISPMIEGLTGISNADVEGAPLFSEIARKVAVLLDGATFVAHNARFDYGFVKTELNAAGIPFASRCLCTVKLSRRVFAEHRRHDLSSIIERHGIQVDARHRAMGDARAVYDFLALIKRTTDPERLESILGELLKASALPAGLDRKIVDGLPEHPGVYLFYGGAGELLYVGKSINIRERVRSHFSGDGESAKQMEMAAQVHHVECRKTAGELGALLLESKLIKELRPLYNSMARRKRMLVVARRRVDRAGYAHVRLEEIDHIEPESAGSILAVYKGHKQAQEHLAELVRSHRLCNKLLGLEQTRSYCFSYHLKQCNGACAGEEPPEVYNVRLEEAFADRRVKAWPYAGGIVIEEKEAASGEGEVFLVDNWCLVSSYRYTELGFQLHIPGSHRFDYDGYKIISRYLTSGSHQRNVRHVGKKEFLQLMALE
jgi:DNA polymerase III subunit epsilon